MDPTAKKQRVTYGEALKKRHDFKGSYSDTANWVVQEFINETPADQVIIIIQLNKIVLAKNIELN